VTDAACPACGFTGELRDLVGGSVRGYAKSERIAVAGKRGVDPTAADPAAADIPGEWVCTNRAT